MVTSLLHSVLRHVFAATALFVVARPLFATAPALDPSSARGVFWKQQKSGKETDVSNEPGTWGYDRPSIFTKLKTEGVNVIVIDINADVRLAAAQVRTDIGQFIKDLYAWDNTMPIRVWLHQRRYFNGGTDLTKTPDQNDAEFDAFAQDMKSIFAAVSTAESALIDGIRWGENGDDNMPQHLKRAVLLARKLNATSYKGATNWLTNHSYVINGYQYGGEFSGLLAAQDSISFGALIGPEVGAFGFAYKHFIKRTINGATALIGAVYDNYRNSFNPAKPDTIQTWQEFYSDELGLDELQQWRNDRNSSKLKNYVYVGDSADSVSTTPDNSLAALQTYFVPKLVPVFMIPVAASSDTSGYYNDQKILFWMSGPTSTPTFTTSTGATYWYNGW